MYWASQQGVSLAVVTVEKIVTVVGIVVVVKIVAFVVLVVVVVVVAATAGSHSVQVKSIISTINCTTVVVTTIHTTVLQLSTPTRKLVILLNH